MNLLFPFIDRKMVGIYCISVPKRNRSIINGHSFRSITQSLRCFLRRGNVGLEIMYTWYVNVKINNDNIFILNWIELNKKYYEIFPHREHLQLIQFSRNDWYKSLETNRAYFETEKRQRISPYFKLSMGDLDSKGRRT